MNIRLLYINLEMIAPIIYMAKSILEFFGIPLK